MHIPCHTNYQSAVACSDHLEALCTLGIPLWVCLKAFLICVCNPFFVLICGCFCIQIAQCKIKEWASRDHNNVPIMCHADEHNTSFTKQALKLRATFHNHCMFSKPQLNILTISSELDIFLKLFKHILKVIG